MLRLPKEEIGEEVPVLGDEGEAASWPLSFGTEKDDTA
jgi:hypothetical protein